MNRKTITEMLPMMYVGTLNCVLLGRLWDVIADADGICDVQKDIMASPWHEEMMQHFDMEEHGNELHIYQKDGTNDNRFFLMLVKFEEET